MADASTLTKQRTSIIDVVPTVLYTNRAMQTIMSIDFCSSPLSDNSTMDGRTHLGRASAAVASGAAQWEIEEGKAG